MKSIQNLTNEILGKRFPNSFELVNYAIELGKQMIKSGRPSRVYTPIQNRAFQILQEISENKDLYESFDFDDDQEEEETYQAAPAPLFVDFGDDDEDDDEDDEEIEEDIE